MADIPSNIGAVAAAIRSADVKDSSDLRRLTELCRALTVDCADLIDVAEHQIRTVLTDYDAQKSRRAVQVTRPMRQGRTLVMAAGRRMVATYRTYQRQYAEDMKPKGGKKKFDPKK
jgi:hypothetical protein